MDVTAVLRPCPVCSSTDRDDVFAESTYDPSKLDQFAFASRKFPEYMHHRLIQCPRCDLLYADPVPDDQSLRAAYSEAAFDSGEEAQWASRTYLQLLRRYLRGFPHTDGALDIGTGDGAFLLRLLEVGFSDVHGVEPSATPIAAADPRVRPLITYGMFDRGLFPHDRFNLITCFQTIEHISDPLRLCESALQLLKPGGSLVLVGHDRRALSARLLGKKSPIFDIEHLQLFSQASMRQLLHEAGFVGCTVTRISNCYPLSYWIKLLPVPRPIKSAAIKALNYTRLGRLPLTFPAGNILGIGFRPA